MRREKPAKTTALRDNTATHIAALVDQARVAGLRPSAPLCDLRVGKRTVSQNRTPLDKDILRAAKSLMDAEVGNFGSDCALVLFNANGLVLRIVVQGGDFVAETFGDLMLWAPSFTGPMAHHVALEFKEPGVVCGSDHYLGALGGLFEMAVPLFDGGERLIGAISLLAPEDEVLARVESEPLLHAALHALSRAIGKQYSEQAMARTLRNSEDLAANILSYVDDCLLIVNGFGSISGSNGAAEKAFGLSGTEAGQLYLGYLFRDDPSLVSSICAGSVLNDVRAVATCPQGRKACTVSARPLADASHGGMTIVRVKGLHEEDGNCAELRNIAADTFARIVGDNPAIKKAVEEARFFAPTNAGVLISGATGTGKSLLAHAIHNAHDPEAPFVTVNCAALSRETAAKFLYGSIERDSQLAGVFEQADGGTLFLDGVCDMPLDVQPLFLSLNDGLTFTRIGETVSRQVNFRTIASTSKDLSEMVEQGQFRADVYYRIASVKIELPPLVERIDDVPILANCFIENYCVSRKVASIALGADALDALMTYAWPGNVRQLQTAVKYACDTCKGRIITADNLPSEVMSGGLRNVSAHANVQSFDEMRRERIVQALHATNNNVGAAAKLLGVGQSTLYRQIRRFGIVRTLDRG